MVFVVPVTTLVKDSRQRCSLMELIDAADKRFSWDELLEKGGFSVAFFKWRSNQYSVY